MHKPEALSARTACRSCGAGTLTPIISLGELYVSDFVDDRAVRAACKAPLELVLCNEREGGCGLLQLKHTVSNEIMYRNYWYRSGTNQSMTNELQGIARSCRELVELNPDDCVIDIGCNDGTLLRAYGKGHCIRVGFEPSRNLMPVAVLNAEKVINDFFNYEAWAKEFPGKTAKIVTAIAMFYDLEDPNAFVSDVRRSLHKDGIFVIQMSYLPLMLSQNAFDNICHEHLEYYSLLSLENLLGKHGLEVFDVELNEVNGGSFRIFIRHGGTAAVAARSEGKERLEKLRNDEKALGLSGRKVYDDFVGRVGALKKKTIDFIKSEVAKGKKIYVYGASTKGNTLLQFYGLDRTLIPFAAERNQDKWGKNTVGSAIPIISEEQARADKPDYFLVLPWHFIDEFVEREREFFTRGGKFILPLPEFKIIGCEI